MIDLTRRVVQCRLNVFTFHVRIAFQDLRLRSTTGQHVQPILHADAHAPDARPTTALVRIEGDSLHLTRALTLWPARRVASLPLVTPLGIHGCRDEWRQYRTFEFISPSRRWRKDPTFHATGGCDRSPRLLIDLPRCSTGDGEDRRTRSVAFTMCGDGAGFCLACPGEPLQETSSVDPKRKARLRSPPRGRRPFLLRR